MLSLESAGQWQWSKWMGETRWGGKRTLASEVLPWDPHRWTHECLRRTSYSPLQTMPPGPQGGAQVCKDGLSRHTGKRWLTPLRGDPRAGLGQRVWAHSKETRGFLCSGDPWQRCWAWPSPFFQQSVGPESSPSPGTNRSHRQSPWESLTLLPICSEGWGILLCYQTHTP